MVAIEDGVKWLGNIIRAVVEGTLLGVGPNELADTCVADN